MTQDAVYLAGCGLLSSRGDLAQTVQSLRLAPTDPAAVEVAPGWRWPLHVLPATTGDWSQRMTQAVRAVVAQTGIVPAADVPLLLASSSLDIGYEEEQAAKGREGFAGDQHTLADVVARALDWPGPVICFSTACTSAVQALLAARDWLNAGDAAEALVLGVELDNHFTPAGFGGLQLLSPDRARPFSDACNGLVLGQAVAALHVRRAPARWRLVGGANVVDGSQPTGAVPQAIEAAARDALAEAGIGPADVDLLKPQAAGSPANDAAEAQALQSLFGATVPPLIGFKPWVGHTMGASAAVELALLMSCLDADIWPTPDRTAPEPQASADVVPGLAWASASDASLDPSAPRRVLFHTIGFGGGHTALVIERGAS